MTAFRPLVPAKALELIEAAGIAHGPRLIRDHAAAGLVKSYAAKVEITQVAGGKTCVLDGTIPPDLWHRMIREGVDEDVWTGGTVRLAPAELIGGAPAVNITGIGFNEDDLLRLVARHSGTVGTPRQRAEQKPLQPQVRKQREDAPPAVLPRRSPDPTAIPPGAILATIKQTQAALGLGRTKVNELMNEGRLIRRNIDGGVRIEVTSIRRLAGAG